MIRFLLDSNVVISMLNQPHGRVAASVLIHEAGELATSSLVLHELYFGAYKSERKSKNMDVLEGLPIPVLSFDREDAREAGRIRAHLKSAGTPIGPYDVLIAGQAVRHGLTLVSANLREFERVPELVCEDWSR